MSGDTEYVRVVYSGPTETIGSRFTVVYRGRRRRRPYDHAASDPFAEAVASAFGIETTRLRRVHLGRRRDPDARTYEVTE